MCNFITCSQSSEELNIYFIGQLGKLFWGELVVIVSVIYVGPLL